MKALICDTETHSAEDPIILEYGEAEFNFEQTSYLFTRPEGTFVSRHGCSVPIEPGAMAVHGITDEDVAGLLPYLKMNRGVDYLIGHQIDFDADAIGDTTAKRICTLALSRQIWPEAGSHKLMALVFMLDVGVGKAFFGSAHSVKTDIEACDFLLCHIINMLQPMDMEHLYLMSEDARIPKIMSFSKFKGRPVAAVDSGWRDWYRKQADPDEYLLKAFALQPFDRNA